MLSNGKLDFGLRRSSGVKAKIQRAHVPESYQTFEADSISQTLACGSPTCQQKMTSGEVGVKTPLTRIPLVGSGRATETLDPIFWPGNGRRKRRPETKKLVPNLAPNFGPNVLDPIF